MKNFFKNACKKVRAFAVAARRIAADKKAENYVDSGVKILIAVVIGALLLGLLYTLFNTNIMPTVTQRITSLFNYTGN